MTPFLVSLKFFFIRFGTKLYRQVVGIPVCTYCGPLVSDLLCFYDRDFMMYLSYDKHLDNIDAFYTTFRYLDGI